MEAGSIIALGQCESLFEFFVLFVAFCLKDKGAPSMRNGTGTSTALRQPQVFIAPGLGRFAHDSVRRVRREIPRFCSMIVKEASVNLAAAARTMADSHGAMPLRTLQTIDGLGASASNTAVIAVPVELTDVRAKLDNGAALSPTSIAEPGPRA